MTNPPNLSSTALRVAAVCAFASAITTFLLWLLARFVPPPGTFEDAVARHANVPYMTRLWVNFIHIFFALTAYGAASWIWARRSPALAWVGFVAFLLWGFTELLGVSINIFAVNGTWRASYAAATPEMQAILKTQITAFAAVWDGIFFLLLVGFFIASLAHGMVAWRGQGLERALGALTLAAVPLTALIMLGGYTSFTALDPVADWVYPFLQPVSRSTLGLWLWRQSRL